MKQDVHLCEPLNSLRGFARFEFSEKMLRFQQRDSANILVTIASDHDLGRVLMRFRGQLALASDDVINQLRAHNSKIIRLISVSADPAQREGLFAYIPLNQTGVEQLATGQFSGMAPNTEWICAEDEQPAALYVWLVYTPGFFGAAIPALGRLFDEIAPSPCPIFTRAVNLHARQLDQSIGFCSARSLYPECASDLLVVQPVGMLPRRSMPRLSVEVARDLSDYAKVITVRASTYIAEQFCHYDEEFDGNDLTATHWLGYVDGDAAGCIRARFFADFAKIERLAVRPEYRQSKLAFKLVRAAIMHCRLKGYTRLYGHSREDLVPFWRLFGFERKRDSSCFSFADVSYVEMVATFPAVPEAITLASDPMIVLRPEGAWDQPGPFERPPPMAGSARSERIAMRMRKLGRLAS